MNSINPERTSKYAVLVIESNPDDRETISSFLRAAGFAVHETSSCEEGIRLASEKNPDIILLCLQMGSGIDGFDTCMKLKQNPVSSGIPVIFVSSQHSAEHKVRGLRSGAVDFIAKPCEGNELLARIHSHVQTRNAHTHLVQMVQEHTQSLLTERESAGEALRIERERLLDIIAFLPDATFVIDNEKRVVAWNRAAEAMTGIPSEKIIGEGDHAYSLAFWGERRLGLIDYLGEPMEEAAGFYHRVRLSGEQLSAEAYLPNIFSGKGAQVWAIAAPLYDGQGNRVGAIEALRDITEQKKSQDALQEAETRARALFDLSSGFIGLLSTDGTLLHVNQTALDFVGTTAAEVIGMPFWEGPWFSHSKDVQTRVHSAIGEAAQGKLMRIEVTHIATDQTLHTVDLTVKPVRDAAGTVTHLIPEGRDITERVVAEKARESLHAQLVQAQKMDVVGRLAGGVAHDFNNMLGVILGRAEMAMERISPQDPLHSYLRDIVRAGNHSADLTRQLLAFARKQAMDPMILDPNETIENSNRMLRRLIGEDLDLVWKPGEHVGFIMMDPFQIDQILANLCVNARDAIQGPGRICIETRSATLDAGDKGAHSNAAPGDYVRITVSDNGCGMDAEVLEHIFEPFFTTKDQGKGTGLGLATVYGIIQQNHGFIEVSSEPGKGSTFHTFLPTAKAKTAEPKASTFEHLPQGSGETILLVEDDESLYNFYTEALRSMNYRVLGTTAPLEAIPLAKAHSREIKLLLTDVVMPQMNGRELVECIHSWNPDLKCIYMSGYPANIIADQGVQEEGIRFLQKPFSMRALSIAIQRALAPNA